MGIENIYLFLFWGIQSSNSASLAGGGDRDLINKNALWAVSIGPVEPEPSSYLKAPGQNKNKNKRSIGTK